MPIQSIPSAKLSTTGHPHTIQQPQFSSRWSNWPRLNAFTTKTTNFAKRKARAVKNTAVNPKVWYGAALIGLGAATTGTGFEVLSDCHPSFPNCQVPDDLRIAVRDYFGTTPLGNEHNIPRATTILSAGLSALTGTVGKTIKTVTGYRARKKAKAKAKKEEYSNTFENWNVTHYGKQTYHKMGAGLTKVHLLDKHNRVVCVILKGGNAINQIPAEVGQPSLSIQEIEALRKKEFQQLSPFLQKHNAYKADYTLRAYKPIGSKYNTAPKFVKPTPPTPPPSSPFPGEIEEIPVTASDLATAAQREESVLEPAPTFKAEKPKKKKQAKIFNLPYMADLVKGKRKTLFERNGKRYKLKRVGNTHNWKVIKNLGSPEKIKAANTQKKASLIKASA